MDEKLKVIAYVRLVSNGDVEDGKSTLSLKVEKINVILNDDIIGSDPEINIEVVGIEE